MFAPDPKSVLFEPVTSATDPELCPTAVLFEPVVIFVKVTYPTAVLFDPVVFLPKTVSVEDEPPPTAVLLLPVLNLKVLYPYAVLLLPDTFVKREDDPVAML